MPEITVSAGQKITNMIIVLLSCAFISLYHFAIWLLIPHLNGTKDF